jgi:carbon storage regulator
MLILRRREGEAVLIGEDVEIRVVEVGGGRVKLGISAPAEVLILREEIHLAAEQNLAAAQAATQENIRRLLSGLQA